MPSGSRSAFRVGRYELLTKLASGGMGEIYIARHTGAGAFEKRVALKLILPHLAEEEDFVRMFLDEARIAARMNHPNIVPIFDVGEEKGQYFIAMALVEGVSLAHLLGACRADGRLLPIPVVNAIATGLCEGLRYAHELVSPQGEPRGVVHRDVSPGNILVSSAGVVMLTDFGVAKAQDNLHRTRSGQVKGKYAYMPPEQMRLGASIDARADLFSATVTLYETLTLVSPFQRSTDPETIDAVREGTVTDVTTLRPELPPAMDTVFRRGMALNPEKRFKTARELLAAATFGPVASPVEVSTLVEALCGKELLVFRNTPMDAVASPHTVSMPGERRASGKGLFVLLGAGAALVLALGLYEMRASPEPGPDGETAAAVAPAPPPEEEPPASEIEPPEPIALAQEPSKDAGALIAAAKPPVRQAISPHRRRSVASSSRSREEPRTGYLSADATPWAVLVIDGREVDRTPVSRYPLPVGEHSVVFRHPSTARELRRQVRISPDKEVSLRVSFAE